MLLFELFAYPFWTYHIYICIMEGPESRIMEWGEKVGSVQFVAATSVVRVLLRALSVWRWDSVFRWDLTGSQYFNKNTPWSLSQSYLFATSFTRASVMAIFMLQALMPNVPRVWTTNSDNSTNTKIWVWFFHTAFTGHLARVLCNVKDV